MMLGQYMQPETGKHDKTGKHGKHKVSIIIPTCLPLSCIVIFMNNSSSEPANNITVGCSYAARYV